MNVEISDAQIWRNVKAALMEIAPTRVWAGAICVRLSHELSLRFNTLNDFNRFERQLHRYRPRDCREAFWWPFTEEGRRERLIVLDKLIAEADRVARIEAELWPTNPAEGSGGR